MPAAIPVAGPFPCSVCSSAQLQQRHWEGICQWRMSVRGRDTLNEALTPSTVGPAGSQFSRLRGQATGQWLGLLDEAVGSIRPQEPRESTVTKLCSWWP